MTTDDATRLERSARIATSTWSDALDEFGINGVVHGMVRRSGAGRFAARAVTVKEVSGPLGTYPRSAFSVASIVDAVGPGQVLMIDARGGDSSTFGGMAALAVSMRGATAVIVDGACRDVEEIMATSLWVASRAVTPVSGKARIKVESINEPVAIGGLVVRPGDLVVGDETGVIVVPADRIDQVLAAAERLAELDQKIAGALKAGRTFGEATAAVDYI